MVGDVLDRLQKGWRDLTELGMLAVVRHSGPTMLLCSASAAARKRSISARESWSEGLVLAIGAQLLI
ncbi:hypothetical protein X727_32810 [Mesorhizobium sp. L103C119B0]|nr:hypothetical protein X753_28555 [Mesorhizobium sp. LNJC399B00]ESZ56846.1 hypothetical protein X727_32810 [Mesorhizobium sp. L103C119B0]